ncbi:MAG: hypothetical protein D6805_08290 [Planctomycetota bacterium]|nr:MAG: hypothetical protein D6805_08290 [Planctomycetota bacterium]
MLVYKGTYTPPVAIYPAAYISGGSSPDAGSIRVLWLNTANHSNAVAQSRNWDAIILFLQEEVKNPGDANSNTTTRLWSAYFKWSWRGIESTTVTDAVSKANLTFRWGFQTNASPVDDDPDDKDTGTTRLDVFENGFVSDSYCGSYGVMGVMSTRPFYNAETISGGGDPTTFVWALWSQSPDANTGRRYLAKQFDLTLADGYSFPTTSANQLGVPADISQTEDNNSNWIGHNGSIIADWGDNGGSDNNDPVLTHYAFTANGGSSGVTFTNTESGQNLSDVFPSPANLYGGDHGLGFTLVFYEEKGYTAGGTKQGDQDIYAATFDPNTGNLLGASAVEIDEFTSKNGTGRDADTNLIGTRISRDKSYIAVLFTQLSTNDPNATSANKGCKVVVYDTRYNLSSTNPPYSTATRLTANMGQANEADVIEAEFQVELADGTWCDPLCAIQSNVSIMHILYVQNSTTQADPDRELHLVGFGVTLSSTAAPTVNIVTQDTIIAANDADWNGTKDNKQLSLAHAAAYDNGSGEGVNVVFAAQANNSKSDPTASGAYQETRLFHWIYGNSTVDTDTATPLSSDGIYDSLQYSGRLAVITSARSTSSGNWGGYYTHIFFDQFDATGDSDRLELWHAYWNKTSSPAALSQAKRISPPQSEGVTTTSLTSSHVIGTYGSNVGIFYIYNDFEEGMIFYDEWSPSNGWKSAPDRVDNYYFSRSIADSPTNVSVALDIDGAPGSCDDLPGTIIAYPKELDRDSLNNRLLLRVRNE